MNEQLELLVSLQEVDTAILSIAEEIEALPDKLNRAKAQVKEANTSFEKIKAEQEKMDKQKKQKYDELEEIQEKINKLKAKGSEIKTNKEYEAHLKEIKIIEQKKDHIEEEILSTMEALDELAKDMKKEEPKLRRAEESFQQEGRVLEEDKNRLHAKMETYKAKRKEIVRKIEEEVYEKYMNLTKSVGGSVVVETRNEVCLGCNTNIPPQLYNDIKENKGIFACYYCNRFLYYKEHAISNVLHSEEK